MNEIFFTSDLHFNHDKPFIWEARGFKSVEDMNRGIISNWNSIVKPDDDVYILGDLMLGSNIDDGLNLISQLHGNLYIVRGNHDSIKRIQAYTMLPNVRDVCRSLENIVSYGQIFVLNHKLKVDFDSKDGKFIHLFGHTHQTEKFGDIPYTYNVGVDAHNCCPIRGDKIIEDCAKRFAF